MSRHDKIASGRSTSVDPELVALVRALARADAEDDVADRLAKARKVGRKAA